MNAPQAAADVIAENGAANNHGKDNSNSNNAAEESPATSNGPPESSGEENVKNNKNSTSSEEEKDESQKSGTASSTLSSAGGKAPPFQYDPNKISLKFIFANRDGINVILECNPTDTIGEVKGALLSMWPEDMPECSGGDKLRLICMGKGILMPDTKTLESAEVPIFKTHPTPVNVSVKPEFNEDNAGKGSPKKNAAGGGGGSSGGGGGASNSGGGAGRAEAAASTGCSCAIL